MSTIGEAFVTIRPDTTGFEQETTAGVQGTLTRIAGLIGGAIVFRKVGEGIVSAVDAGSDLNETISKTEVVFGDLAPKALKFGNNAATAFGTSKQQGLEMLSTLGNLFVSMGLNEGQALDMSSSMVQLAGDLGSFNNVPTAEALEAIRSGLIGETEPLRRFGVNLNEATIQQKALEMGISDGTAALTPAQKAQAAYALILDQTKTAQGDFARTADGAANKQKILTARMEDIRAKIGQGLVPVFERLLTVGGKVIDWLQRHKTVAKALAVLIGGALVAAFVAWAVAAGQAAVATIAATWPVLAIIAAVAALVAGVYLLWDNWDTVWNWIKEHPAIAAIIAILAWPITLIAATVAIIKVLYENWGTIWPAIQGVLQDVWSVIEPIVNFLRDRIQNVIDVAQWLGDRAPGWFAAFADAAQKVYDTAKVPFEALKSLMEDIGNIGAGLAKAIIDGFKGAWNAAANTINDAIPDKIAIPFAPDIDLPDTPVPTLHQGGIFHAPPGQREGYALLEDGERVLTKEQQRRRDMAGMGAGMVIQGDLIVQSGREVQMLDYWAQTRMAGV